MNQLFFFVCSKKENPLNYAMLSTDNMHYVLFSYKNKNWISGKLRFWGKSSFARFPQQLNAQIAGAGGVIRACSIHTSFCGIERSSIPHRSIDQRLSEAQSPGRAAARSLIESICPRSAITLNCLSTKLMSDSPKRTFNSIQSSEARFPKYPKKPRSKYIMKTQNNALMSMNSRNDALGNRVKRNWGIERTTRDWGSLASLDWLNWRNCASGTGGSSFARSIDLRSICPSNLSLFGESSFARFKGEIAASQQCDFLTSPNQLRKAQFPKSAFQTRARKAAKRFGCPIWISTNPASNNRINWVALNRNGLHNTRTQSQIRPISTAKPKRQGTLASTQQSIFFNRCFDKGRLKALISWYLLCFGQKKTVELVEKLKELGFSNATKAGISLNVDDLKISPAKASLIRTAEYQTYLTSVEFEKGNLTSIERFQHLIDTWHRTSELLKQNVIDYFKSTDVLNPVYMMAFSGARGNISQVRQLVGMRGLMADPQGQIIDFPIQSNFREGLTLTEYVISCYGARKGLVDTALRTATSGYLTRRLVDVAQHVIVSIEDCQTIRGVILNDLVLGNKIILSLRARLVGRVLAEDIFSEKIQIGSRNQELTENDAFQISQIRTQVKVRSPLTCQAKNSVCQFCYGWSLATSHLVDFGEAVGVIAAQSIGEPGTQLTMRTFHTGGVFSADIMDQIQAPYNGKVHYKKPIEGSLTRTPYGKIAFLTKNEGQLIIVAENLFGGLGFAQSNRSLSPNDIPTTENALGDRSSIDRSLHFNDLTISSKHSPQSEKSSILLSKEIQISPYTLLFVRHKEQVVKNQLIGEFSSLTAQKNQSIKEQKNIFSEITGEVFFNNVFLYEKIIHQKIKKQQYLLSKEIIRESACLGWVWVLSAKRHSLTWNLFPNSKDLIFEFQRNPIAGESSESRFPRNAIPPTSISNINDSLSINCWGIERSSISQKRNFPKPHVPNSGAHTKNFFISSIGGIELRSISLENSFRSLVKEIPNLGVLCLDGWMDFSLGQKVREAQYLKEKTDFAKRNPPDFQKFRKMGGLTFAQSLKEPAHSNDRAKLDPPDFRSQKNLIFSFLLTNISYNKLNYFINLKLPSKIKIPFSFHWLKSDSPNEIVSPNFPTERSLFSHSMFLGEQDLLAMPYFQIQNIQPWVNAKQSGESTEQSSMMLISEKLMQPNENLDNIATRNWNKKRKYSVTKKLFLQLFSLIYKTKTSGFCYCENFYIKHKIIHLPDCFVTRNSSKRLSEAQSPGLNNHCLPTGKRIAPIAPISEAFFSENNRSNALKSIASIDRNDNPPSTIVSFERSEKNINVSPNRATLDSPNSVKKINILHRMSISNEQKQLRESQLPQFTNSFQAHNGIHAFWPTKRSSLDFGDRSSIDRFSYSNPTSESLLVFKKRFLFICSYFFKMPFYLNKFEIQSGKLIENQSSRLSKTKSHQAKFNQNQSSEARFPKHFNRGVLNAKEPVNTLVDRATLDRSNNKLMKPSKTNERKLIIDEATQLLWNRAKLDSTEAKINQLSGESSKAQLMNDLGDRASLDRSNQFNRAKLDSSSASNSIVGTASLNYLCSKPQLHKQNVFLFIDFSFYSQLDSLKLQPINPNKEKIFSNCFSRFNIFFKLKKLDSQLLGNRASLDSPEAQFQQSNKRVNDKINNVPNDRATLNPPDRVNLDSERLSDRSLLIYNQSNEANKCDSTNAKFFSGRENSILSLSSYEVMNPIRSFVFQNSLLGLRKIKHNVFPFNREKLDSPSAYKCVNTDLTSFPNNSIGFSEPNPHLSQYQYNFSKINNWSKLNSLECRFFKHFNYPLLTSVVKNSISLDALEIEHLRSIQPFEGSESPQIHFVLGNRASIDWKNLALKNWLKPGRLSRLIKDQSPQSSEAIFPQAKTENFDSTNQNEKQLKRLNNSKQIYKAITIQSKMKQKCMFNRAKLDSPEELKIDWAKPNPPDLATLDQRKYVFPMMNSKKVSIFADNYGQQHPIVSQKLTTIKKYSMSFRLCETNFTKLNDSMLSDRISTFSPSLKDLGDLASVESSEARFHIDRSNLKQCWNNKNFHCFSVENRQGCIKNFSFNFDGWVTVQQTIKNDHLIGRSRLSQINQNNRAKLDSPNELIERSEIPQNVLNSLCIRPGWVYFPSNQVCSQQLICGHKSTYFLGAHLIDDISFDQHLVYTEWISVPLMKLSSIKELGLNRNNNLIKPIDEVQWRFVCGFKNYLTKFSKFYSKNDNKDISFKKLIKDQSDRASLCSLDLPALSKHDTQQNDSRDLEHSFMSFVSNSYSRFWPKKSSFPLFVIIRKINTYPILSKNYFNKKIYQSINCAKRNSPQMNSSTRSEIELLRGEARSPQANFSMGNENRMNSNQSSEARFPQTNGHSDGGAKRHAPNRRNFLSIKQKNTKLISLLPGVQINIVTKIRTPLTQIKDNSTTSNESKFTVAQFSRLQPTNEAKITQSQLTETLFHFLEVNQIKPLLRTSLKRNLSFNRTTILIRSSESLGVRTTKLLSEHFPSASINKLRTISPTNERIEVPKPKESEFHKNEKIFTNERNSFSGGSIKDQSNDFLKSYYWLSYSAETLKPSKVFSNLKLTKQLTDFFSQPSLLINRAKLDSPNCKNVLTENTSLRENTNKTFNEKSKSSLYSNDFRELAEAQLDQGSLSDELSNKKLHSLQHFDTKPQCPDNEFYSSSSIFDKRQLLGDLASLDRLNINQLKMEIWGNGSSIDWSGTHQISLGDRSLIDRMSENWKEDLDSKRVNDLDSNEPIRSIDDENSLERSDFLLTEKPSLKLNKRQLSFFTQKYFTQQDILKYKPFNILEKQQFVNLLEKNNKKHDLAAINQNFLGDLGDRSEIDRTSGGSIFDRSIKENLNFTNILTTLKENKISNLIQNILPLKAYHSLIFSNVHFLKYLKQVNLSESGKNWKSKSRLVENPSSRTSSSKTNSIGGDRTKLDRFDPSKRSSINFHSQSFNREYPLTVNLLAKHPNMFVNFSTSLFNFCPMYLINLFVYVQPYNDTQKVNFDFSFRMSESSFSQLSATKLAQTQFGEFSEAQLNEFLMHEPLDSSEIPPSEISPNQMKSNPNFWPFMRTNIYDFYQSSFFKTKVNKKFTNWGDRASLDRTKTTNERTSLKAIDWAKPNLPKDHNTIKDLTREVLRLNNNQQSQIITLNESDHICLSTFSKKPLMTLGEFLQKGSEIAEGVGSTCEGQIISIQTSKITVRHGKPIFFLKGGIFHVNHGNFVDAKSSLITLSYQRLKTEDIVQGIPKIEEFFEARQTDQLHLFFEKAKNQYALPEAVRKSLEIMQQIIVNGVQSVYQSQGVNISDKHVEIIVRQMTSKVRIVEGGNTGLLKGELVLLDWIELINLGTYGKKAQYEPVILGITKAALETESFISAASFQETTRILSRAAIENKIDFLRGLKENVILGHFIPAGTGFSRFF